MKMTGIALGLMLADHEQVLAIGGLCVLAAIGFGVAVFVMATWQSPRGSTKKSGNGRGSNRKLLKFCSWLSVILGVGLSFSVLQIALIGFIDSDRNWYSVWKLFVIALIPFVAGQFGLYRARGLERLDAARRYW